MGPVEAEIWPGKSEGLVEGKMGKSGAQIRKSRTSDVRNGQACECVSIRPIFVT